MKKLTDQEFAVISSAATIITKLQEKDSRLPVLAYELWNIYNRHGGHLRHRQTKYLAEIMNIHE